MENPNTQSIHVLLADDDIDDCFSFGEALKELSLPTSFSYVNDGEKLMKTVIAGRQLPDILFLDLNMPRKNGFDCLLELKKNQLTQGIPVVIISTSFNPEIIKLLFENGARRYIRKPSDFESLKSVIEKGLASGRTVENISLDDFIINP